MKHFINLLFVIVVCMVLSSCSTSTKFTVLAEPGTEILTKDHNLLGVADNSGKIKVKISDNDYSAFLLSHRPNSNDYIPFALDYDSRSLVGVSLAETTGIFLASVGLIIELAGALAVAAGDDDIGLVMVGGGAGAALLGCSWGGPATERMKQTAYDHRYKYVNRQITNQDLPSQKPDFAKENPININTVTNKVQSTNSIIVTEDNSSKSSKVLSQKSSKTFKDLASLIEGKYIGSGKLTKDGSTIESYDKISVTIRRVSSTIVGVVVAESDGSKFFNEETEYTISKNLNGDYQLILNGISSAKIIIDSQGRLVYVHPKVNIDGDIYQLSINGEK